MTLRNTNRWHCSLPACNTRCTHITETQRFAKEQGVLSDEGLPLAAVDGMPRNDDERAAKASEEKTERRLHRSVCVDPVSHLPRGAVSWSSVVLDLDPNIRYIPPGELRDLPEKLELDDGSRCRMCKMTLKELEERVPEIRGLSEYSPFLVYDVLAARQVSVQTVPCPGVHSSGSPRIGPDLVDLGLFNMDNKHAFTRSVFDEFLNQFTLSETTLVAYWRSTHRRYLARPHRTSIIPFCAEETFRMAFYSFQRVHRLETDMHCPECLGESDVVICDGCVVAFEKRRLTGRLRPPTMPDEGSEVKEAVQLLSLATLSDTSLSVSKKEAADFRTSLDDWAARAKKHLIKLSLVKDDLDLVAKNGKLGKAIQKLVEEVAALHPLEQGDQRAMHLKFLQEVGPVHV